MNRNGKMMGRVQEGVMNRNRKMMGGLRMCEELGYVQDIW